MYHFGRRHWFDCVLCAIACARIKISLRSIAWLHRIRVRIHIYACARFRVRVRVRIRSQTPTLANTCDLSRAQQYIRTRTYARFGLNRRKCAGYDVALREMETIVCEILKKFQITMVAPKQSATQPTMVFLS